MYLNQENVLALLALLAPHHGVTPPWIKITWSEPQTELRDNGSVLSWQTRTAEGPLNQRFVDWHTNHENYWKPKAHVPVKLVSVDFDPYAGRDKFLRW